jgi:hypothetical protein
VSLAKRLSKMTLEDLRDLNHRCIAEINQRLREEGEAVARKLDPGDRVYFEHRGDRVVGVLRKIGVKNAKVEIEEERDDGKIEVRTWSVPTAMLKRADPSKGRRKLHHKKIPQKKAKPATRRVVKDDFERDEGEL